ncbi:MAG: hypothetical protein NVSMB63_13900 [Sediminibacterium sp.]
MSIKVRSADSDDATSIFQFICELEESSFDYTVFESYYITNIRNLNYIYLVAVNDVNTVIGYISCHGQILLHHCGKVFEIQELFVVEEYRHRGIGQLLLQSVESSLAKQDVKSLEVTANNNRIQTHAFYKKSGFSQTHLKFTRHS